MLMMSGAVKNVLKKHRAFTTQHVFNHNPSKETKQAIARKYTKIHHTSQNLSPPLLLRTSMAYNTQ